MRFKNFLETAVGSKVKIKVILFLLKETFPTSEREIARVIGVSHMSVNRVMDELYGINLVFPAMVGNVRAWELKKDSYAYSVLKDLAKLSKSPLEDLKEEVTSALKGMDVKKAFIFGSVAAGEERPDSDIDLLVIVDDPKKKKRILKALEPLENTCLAKYGNMLSPYVITEAESKKQKWVNNSITKGIRILG